MILAFISCQKEEDYIIEPPSINIQKVKKMYESQFNIKAFPNIKSKPIWNELKAYYDNSGDLYFEIPYQSINQNDIKEGNSYSFDKLIVHNNEKNINLSIVHFFALDTKSNPVNFKSITSKELYNFSGFLTKYDLNKNVIESNYYLNGDNTYSSVNINHGSKKSDLLLSKANDEENEEQTIHVEYVCVRDCFTLSNEQGEVEQYYGCSPWKCSITSYTIIGGPGGTIESTSHTTVEKVDHIDDSNLTDPKIKCLNSKLNASGDSFIKDILKNLTGNTDINIKIESKDRVYNSKNEEVVGLTKGVNNGVINIQMNSQLASTKASLEVVRTLIHEYIHADIYRKVHEDSDLHKDPVFKETYNKYKDAMFEPSQHHSTMADLYINQMRDALKNYHKNVLTASYNYITSNGTNTLPDIFYEGLAWRGLKEQNVQAWKDKGNDTIAIKNAVNTHYSKLSTTYCPNN